MSVRLFYFGRPRADISYFFLKKGQRYRSEENIN
jgi:hypothetical protein